MQSLEDRESKLRREVIKSCNSSSYLKVNNENNRNDSPNSFRIKNRISITRSIASRSSSVPLSHSKENNQQFQKQTQQINTQQKQNIIKIKKLNFLHFSNKLNDSKSDLNTENGEISTSDDENKENIINYASYEDYFLPKEKPKNDINFSNFKNAFNTLSKLNKSVNIFTGNYLNVDNNYLDHFVSFLNVHASMPDVCALSSNVTSASNIYNNYTNNSYINNNNSQSLKQAKKSTTVSLCSNVSNHTNKPFGNGNHSTMLFEHNNVKIGFMALVDEQVFNKLKCRLQADNVEYIDYLLEANRLSKQLRLSGANLIVAIVNMESEASERRLLNESYNVDLIFSTVLSKTGDTECIQSETKPNRWLIRTQNNFDSISLVTLNLDEFNSNKLVDIAITKYYPD